MWQNEEAVTFVKLQKFEENFFFVLYFYTFLNGTSFYTIEILTYSSKKSKPSIFLEVLTILSLDL